MNRDIRGIISELKYKSNLIFTLKEVNIINTRAKELNNKDKEIVISFVDKNNILWESLYNLKRIADMITQYNITTIKDITYVDNLATTLLKINTEIAINLEECLKQVDVIKKIKPFNNLLLPLFHYLDYLNDSIIHDNICSTVKLHIRILSTITDYIVYFYKDKELINMIKNIESTTISTLSGILSHKYYNKYCI